MQSLCKAELDYHNIPPDWNPLAQRNSWSILRITFSCAFSFLAPKHTWINIYMPKNLIWHKEVLTLFKVWLWWVWMPPNRTISGDWIFLAHLDKDLEAPVEGPLQELQCSPSRPRTWNGLLKRPNCPLCSWGHVPVIFCPSTGFLSGAICTPCSQGKPLFPARLRNFTSWPWLRQATSSGNRKGNSRTSTFVHT